ncbi:hypothetical protein OGM63_00815 [Plectonema radiosum NIES-515]|uniref:Uncharacterized protein n=1 Tax=Plectonema radiosum NIES-515 TaxID=2986073 RepID=A0ABT3ASH5_9CYAN|nr:hypothetical protein [Plectonema radiosum]MCV3212078.1 hypothetical protein [Plectonema radiosum NIES-515]
MSVSRPKSSAIARLLELWQDDRTHPAKLLYLKISLWRSRSLLVCFLRSVGFAQSLCVFAVKRDLRL